MARIDVVPHDLHRLADVLNGAARRLDLQATPVADRSAWPELSSSEASAFGRRLDLARSEVADGYVTLAGRLAWSGSLYTATDRVDG